VIAGAFPIRRVVLKVGIATLMNRNASRPDRRRHGRFVGSYRPPSLLATERGEPIISETLYVAVTLELDDNLAQSTGFNQSMG